MQWLDVIAGVEDKSVPLQPAPSAEGPLQLFFYQHSYMLLSPFWAEKQFQLIWRWKNMLFLCSPVTKTLERFGHRTPDVVSQVLEMFPPSLDLLALVLHWWWEQHHHESWWKTVLLTHISKHSHWWRKPSHRHRDSCDLAQNLQEVRLLPLTE